LILYTSNHDMKSHTLPPPAPAHDPLPRTAKSWSRSSFPAAAPASRCHVNHGGHMWPVFRVNSSFSSVIGRKRRQKHAVQHCPRHNLITWASILIPALLNVLLGALRQQRSARALRHRIGTFGGLWGAQDAKNTQEGPVCGTISSHGPLYSYLNH